MRENIDAGVTELRRANVGQTELGASIYWGLIYGWTGFFASPEIDRKTLGHD